MTDTLQRYFLEDWCIEWRFELPEQIPRGENATWHELTTQLAICRKAQERHYPVYAQALNERLQKTALAHSKKATHAPDEPPHSEGAQAYEAARDARLILAVQCAHNLLCQEHAPKVKHCHEQWQHIWPILHFVTERLTALRPTIVLANQNPADAGEASPEKTLSHLRRTLVDDLLEPAGKIAAGPLGKGHPTANLRSLIYADSLPADDEKEAWVHAIKQIARGFCTLHQNAMKSAANLAEKVEKASGFKPLKIQTQTKKRPKSPSFSPVSTPQETTDTTETQTSAESTQKAESDHAEPSSESESSRQEKPPTVSEHEVSNEQQIETEISEPPTAAQEHATPQQPADIVRGIGRLNGRYDILRVVEENTWGAEYAAIDAHAGGRKAIRAHTEVPEETAQELTRLAQSLQQDPHAGIAEIETVLEIQNVQNAPNTELPLSPGQMAVVGKELVYGQWEKRAETAVAANAPLQQLSDVLMRLASGLDCLAAKGFTRGTFTADVVAEEQDKTKIVADRLLLQADAGDTDGFLCNFVLFVAQTVCPNSPNVPAATDKTVDHLVSQARLTSSARAILKQALEGKDGNFDSCMEFMAALIQADTVDASLFLSEDQQNWLQEAGYGDEGQLRLVERLRGKNLRAMENEAADITDEELQELLDSDHVNAIKQKRHAKIDLAVKAALVVAFILSIWTWHARRTEPIQSVSVDQNTLNALGMSDLTLKTGITTGKLHEVTGFPSGSRSRIWTNTENVTCYASFSQESPNKRINITFIRPDGNSRDTQSRPMKHDWFWQSSVAHGKREPGQWQAAVHINGRTVAKHPFYVTRLPFVTWWAPVFLAIMFAALFFTYKHLRDKGMLFTY